MSGTSKAVVSMCVLLLAALVVYYGMTPPEESQGQFVDLPVQRPSLFGGDPEEKMIALGIPPIATELVVEQSIPEAVQVEDVVSFTRPEPIVIEVEPAPVFPAEVKIENQVYKTYVVKDGETLGEIASRELGSYRKWREIASLNNITDPSRVMPGRMLRMPTVTATPRIIVTATATFPNPTGSTIHIIQEGETLSSIAGDYYGDVNKYASIVDANPTVNANRLKIGSKITIPEL